MQEGILYGLARSDKALSFDNLDPLRSHNDFHPWTNIPQIFPENKKIRFLRRILSLLIGSGDWIRTSDQLINSQLRYRCATPERVVGVKYIIYYLRLARGFFK